MVQKVGGQLLSKVVKQDDVLSLLRKSMVLEEIKDEDVESENDHFVRFNTISFKDQPSNEDSESILKVMFSNDIKKMVLKKKSLKEISNNLAMSEPVLENTFIGDS
jgi:hypothetical protein